MIRVKNIIGDDIFGLWQVKRIIVTKDRQHFAFSPEEEKFASKDDAERHGRVRAQRFIQRKLGWINGSIVWDALP
jgi:hypothetical protein